MDSKLIILDGLPADPLRFLSSSSMRTINYYIRVFSLL